MESPVTLGSRTPEEAEERRAALERGLPFLMFRDGDGQQRIYALEPAEAVTVGRRFEADISLPWDPEASRLHAELSFRAGEWTICDDGWSQNGTWVNGLRLAGRRRLADGDLVKIGRTIIGYHHPSAAGGPGPTMVQGELSATPRFSEQQQRILRALCKPLFADGDGFNPASDLEVADATSIDVDVVTQELDLLARLFGLEDMPRPERRAEVALLAVRSGLVGADEGGGTQG
jgi:hypothetical protein